MHLAQYLICVATRHEQARTIHQEELRKKNGRRVLTYDNEIALLQGVIGSIRDKPASLKKLPLPAIAILAYVIKSKIANDPYTELYEIIDRLVCDPEETMLYLNGCVELQEQDWLRFLVTPGNTFTDEPPFCWLQSNIELGDAFHLEMGGSQYSRSFVSNDAYLDAIYAYLLEITNCNIQYQVTEPGIDLSSVKLRGWYRTIEQRTDVSTCPLPAAEVRKKFSLSIFQYLTLIGLLGLNDGDLSYDFSFPPDVTNLFAKGRVCRSRMKQHLFGEKSPLLRHRLIEGTNGRFAECIRLTRSGMKALTGQDSGDVAAKSLKHRVKNTTLFDIEEPKIAADSLLLPQQVMEAVRALVFSESRQGKHIRKTWHMALPTAWGSPTGSTVLLYGPPGTGKTLTAQYIASSLKRPLLKIDAARVLSCWVGESEQNVRRIFDDYVSLQKEFGKAPVLLLNEADQLLSARDTSHNAVSRMNNNMQNLFLEGLERFEGVLVATTNRQDLLDEAFSRRFTYKLELPPPERNLRLQLWRNHLPMARLADDVEMEKLADFDLTGGEIRLVVERTVRLLAYRGITTIDNATLMGVAREELTSRMKRYGPRNRIGFLTSIPLEE